MTQFNPVTGSIIQSQQVQRQQPVDKARQVQRHQALAKNSAAHADVFEHQVESTERVEGLHDDEPHHDQQQRKKRRPPPPHDPASPDPADAPPRLDVTA